MSQSKRPQPESSQRPSQDTARPSTKEAPQEPFAKFDDRIAKASDRILTKQPYLITIPSEKPFRRHANDQTRWYMHTPFTRKEEQLQYMSFLLHQDDDEVLMKVDGTRIDEDGRLLAPVQSPRSESQSRPQTPSTTEAGPRKKISLKDYKTKDKSAISTPDSKPVDDIRRQAIKSHKEEVEAKIVEEAKPVQEKKVRQPEPVRKPVPATAPKEESKPSIATSTLQDKDSQRPAKKRRLSAEEVKVSTSKSNGVKPKEENPEKRALPALLSPDMPAPEKAKKTKDLPDLLSPKLPLTLERVVNPPKPPRQRTDEVRDIIKAGLGSPARPTEKKEPTKDPSTGRVRSETQSSVKSAPATKASSPIPRPQSSASNKAVPNGQPASPKPKPELWVTLRYGKKNIKTVSRLLKFKQRPRKESTVPVKKEETAIKTLPKPEPPKPEKKRPIETVSDVPAKKPKLAASLLEPPVKQERPSTPKPEVEGKSPQPAKHKSAFSTPKKELKPEPKSLAMQRVASSDTLGVRTPSQDTGRTSTPLGVGPSSHPKTSPAPTSTPARTDEYTTWTDIHTKVFQIGRNLKKDGSKLAAEGKGKDQARGVVLLIEGLVCFMLNAAAQAQSRPNTDPGWSSILPYHIMVWRQSRPYRHLHGLVVQLGAVVRQYLNQEQIKRLAKETLPDDHITSAPTPGSDGLTKGTSAADDSIKKQKAFLELRDELVQNAKELRIAWLDGPRLLPPDAIEEQYPRTWAKRSTDLSKRNPDRVNPKEFLGSGSNAAGNREYYVPVDVTTNVFEASWFALAFLHEWTLIEGVQWKTQVEFGAATS